MQVFTGPRAGPFLVWTLVVQLVLWGDGVHAADSTKSCTLVHESASERKVLSRLEPLVGKNFTVQTKEGEKGEDEYTYVFQLCGDAAGVPGAGVIQASGAKMEKKTIVGSYSATQAIGGSDWVMLIYTNGTKYDNHCSNQLRKAIILISCNRDVDTGKLDVILEDRDRGKGDCFYLFELDSSAVCRPLQSHISTGSILLIIGFCVLAVYLVGGFLYQRLIVGAKGMEQFPNHAFWAEVGNLSADGCDFVCRSGNREEPPAYRGVATEPLEEEPEERDDHLLPM